MPPNENLMDCAFGEQMKQQWRLDVTVVLGGKTAFPILYSMLDLTSNPSYLVPFIPSIPQLEVSFAAHESPPNF